MALLFRVTSYKFDVISQGIAKLQAYSPEIVLTYGK